MNSYKSEPFKPEHIYLIELQPWERDHLDADKIKQIAQVGMLWTIWNDTDQILAIVGFVKMWEGVYEVVVYPSVHTHQQPIRYVKQIRRYLDTIAREFGMRRQQTQSLATTTMDKWMRVLGFVNEGTLVGYTVEGLDCRMWARFPRYK